MQWLPALVDSGGIARPTTEQKTISPAIGRTIGGHFAAPAPRVPGRLIGVAYIDCPSTISGDPLSRRAWHSDDSTLGSQLHCRLRPKRRIAPSRPLSRCSVKPPETAVNRNDNSSGSILSQATERCSQAGWTRVNHVPMKHCAKWTAIWRDCSSTVANCSRELRSPARHTFLAMSDEKLVWEFSIACPESCRRRHLKLLVTTRTARRSVFSWLPF